MNTETATLSDGRTVQFIPDVIGEGLMKKVYFTADKQSVVCLYKDKKLSHDPRHRARLEKILGSFNMTKTISEGGNARNQADADHFRKLFCWPTGIVMQPRFGVLTPAYPSNFFFASGPWEGEEKEGGWFSRPRLRKMLPPEERGNWLNYLQMCILIARAVRKMHFSGLAHSDLSSKNVLVDPPGARSVVIDVDTLVVPEIFPPDVLGTGGYIAPEVLASSELPLDDPNRRLPCIRTDRHALVVLIYEYLLRRHPLEGPRIVNPNSAEEDHFLSMGEKALFIENPQDTSNRPKNLKVEYTELGPYLTEVFEKAFIKGLHHPNRRPASADCEKALYLTTDLLIPCGNPQCEEKWFIYVQGRPPRCPWCGWTLRSRVPLLKFYRVFRNRVSYDNYYLVGWDKRNLHKWHAIRDLLPNENVDREIIASIRFIKGQWLLFNRALDSMLSPTGNPVPRNQAVLLQEGADIVLSQEENGRRVRVEMIP